MGIIKVSEINIILYNIIYKAVSSTNFSSHGFVEKHVALNPVAPEADFPYEIKTKWT